jgi:hypothetical protein
MVPRWVIVHPRPFWCGRELFTNAFSPAFFLLECHKKKELINLKFRMESFFK